MIVRNDIKRAVAWMLIFTFMQFFAVKSFHYHSENDCNKVSHNHKMSHSCDDCSICHFSLSSFTEAENLEINFFSDYQITHHEFIKDIKATISLCHPYLRAPPVA